MSSDRSFYEWASGEHYPKAYLRPRLDKAISNLYDFSQLHEPLECAGSAECAGSQKKCADLCGFPEASRIVEQGPDTEKVARNTRDYDYNKSRDNDTIELTLNVDVDVNNSKRKAFQSTATPLNVNVKHPPISLLKDVTSPACSKCPLKSETSVDGHGDGNR